MTRKTRLILRSILFATALLGSWALVAPQPLLAQQEQKAAQLAKLLDRLPHAQTQVSAAVMSLPNGKIIYHRNADVVLIPASNQKIIVGAVALGRLLPIQHFETKLALRGDDLVIIGGGDPGLGDPKLAAQHGRAPTDAFADWAKLLTQRGLSKINGDIIVDDTVFDQRWVHDTWEKEDLAKWYAAPVGGLNFNDNCIEVTVWPSAAEQLTRYAVFPKTDWIEIDNRCKAGGANKPWIHRPGEEPIYQLRGRCSRRSELQSVAVTDPGIFTGEVFKAVLESYGIEVSGQVRRERPYGGPTAEPGSKSEIIATVTTPVTDVVTRCLRDSQNLFAECLLKSLGRLAEEPNHEPQQGRWQSGGEVVLRTLGSWGIDTTGMVVADGSGLSRSNRLSAGQVVQILRHVYLDPKIGPRFIDSLALNASRGTLKKRMKDIPGRVWGKTGYMAGIRSLSGYVRADEQTWYAFSVIFNNIRGPTAPYNRIHDNLCRVLASAEMPGD